MNKWFQDMLGLLMDCKTMQMVLWVLSGFELVLFVFFWLRKKMATIYAADE